MITNIDPPQMPSGDPYNQIAQLYRYLFSLTKQLNWAMGEIERLINKNNKKEEG